jgi:hypothetical protein
MEEQGAQRVHEQVYKVLLLFLFIFQLVTHMLVVDMQGPSLLAACCTQKPPITVLSLQCTPAETHVWHLSCKLSPQCTLNAKAHQRMCVFAFGNFPATPMHVEHENHWFSCSTSFFHLRCTLKAKTHTRWCVFTFGTFSCHPVFGG